MHQTETVLVWCMPSSAIITERVLIECLNFNIFGSRLRAIIISFLIILFVGLSNLPEFYSREIVQGLSNRLICSYDAKRHHTWYRAQYIISYFHVIIPSIAHLISIICILTTTARRKIFVGGCYISSQKLKIHHIWLKQLYIHRDFFISPLTIIICIFPHAIVHYILLSKCMKGEGIVSIRLHIALVLILNIPAMLAFVIYVYPNKFYLKEFKQTTIYRLFCRKGKNCERRIQTWNTDKLNEISETGC